MKKYEYNATNRIAEVFEEHEVKFHVINMHGQEEVLAGFSVDNGPKVIMKFISRDNDNDVAARIFGLVSNTPKEKHPRVLEACDILNRKIRYMKFYLDSDGDINVEYDFPVKSSDECIGEMAFEIFIRTMRILDAEYEIFTKALYTDEKLESDEKHSVPDALLQKLEELRKKLEERMEELETEEESPDESDEESDVDITEAEGMDEFAAFLSMLAHDTEDVA